MSKNLESEYKNFIYDQIPDLWDRIEAGLGEQNRGTPLSSNAQTTGTRAPHSVNKGTPRSRYRKPILGIAAAAACVCIVVPLALSAGSGHGMSSSGMMMAEALPEETAFVNASAKGAASAYEEAAEATAPGYEEAFEEAAAEAAAPGYEEAFEEAAAEAAAPEYEAISEDAAASEYARSSAREEALYEASSDEETSPYDAAYTLTNVEFRITSISEEDLAARQVTARIIACPDEPSLAGSTLVLGSSEDTEGVPEEPGTYIRNVFVSVDENGELIYRI